MRWRWIGLALALVVATAATAAVGYRIGHTRDVAPAAFQARPVPAASPSYPVTPAKVVADDPYPALRPGVDLRTVTLGSAPFQVRVPVPRGWVRSDSTAGESRWYPASDKQSNVYFVRVRLIGMNYQSVPSATRGRIAALDGATAVDDLVVESSTDDRFVARYVSGEHLRVDYEGFVPRDDVAFVSIAVIGRESDRAGLKDLFERMMAGAEV